MLTKSTNPSEPPKESYIDETIRYVVFDKFGYYRGILSSTDKSLYQDTHISNSTILLSNDIKYLPPIGHRFFHLILETLPTILLEIEARKKINLNSTVVVPTFTDKSSRSEEYNSIVILKIFLKKLIELGVNVIELPFEDTFDKRKIAFPFKNMYTTDLDSTPYTWNLGRDFYRTLLQYPSENPTTLAFLSRAGTRDTKAIPKKFQRHMESNFNITYAPNQNRIDKELDVINYLNKTVELKIIVPEKFQTFEEQLETFSSVKVLIGATGSGLANCIFMQPGSVLVELTTPLTVYKMEEDNLEQSYHNHYSILAAVFGLVYISIPNNRSASSIIENMKALSFPDLLESLSSIN